MLSMHSLKKAKPDAVLRLAQWLRLKTKDMSPRQIAKLVRWRIKRGGNLTDDHSSLRRKF
jgi:hypothetical protein